LQRRTSDFKEEQLQGIRRTVTAAALTLAAVAAAAVPAHAAAGPGAGLGPSTFHLEDLVSGASDFPRVMMLDEQNALVALGTYAASPSGQIRVCKVGPPPAAACAAPGPILTPGFSGVGYLAIHPGLTPGTIYLTNGTANETELYTSTDGGTTFSGPVRISTYVNAQDFLVLPDGRLALVGAGNQNPALATHFVVVPTDGSGLVTPGFYIPGDISERGIAYNGGKFVILGSGYLSGGSTSIQANYAVFSGAGDPNSQANWTVGTLPYTSTDVPNIAEGAAGVVAVGTNDYKVQAAVLSGTTFGPMTTINKNSAYLPNVTGDPSGRYTATWQVNSVGLQMAQSRDGVHWSTPLTINSDREYQTDTARTAAGNGLAVTLANSKAYIATRLYGSVDLTLKASPTKVKKGKQSTLTATLHDEGGTGIAGQKITFQAGSKTVGSGTTNAGGQATVKVKPSKSTSYTAVFAGSATLASYTSGNASVKVTTK
jgi:hypothetical protein